MKIFKLTILSIFTLATLYYFSMSYKYIQDAKIVNVNNITNNTIENGETLAVIYDISNKSSNQIVDETIQLLTLSATNNQTEKQFVDSINMPYIITGTTINNISHQQLSEEQLLTDRYTNILLKIGQLNMDNSIESGNVIKVTMYINDYNKAIEIYTLLSANIEENSDKYNSNNEGTSWVSEGFIYDDENEINKENLELGYKRSSNAIWYGNMYIVSLKKLIMVFILVIVMSILNHFILENIIKRGLYIN